MLPFTSTPPSSERSRWKQFLHSRYETTQKELQPLKSSWSSLPDNAKLGIAIVGSSLLTVAGVWVYKRHMKRIPNSQFVTAEDFNRRRWITGIVTSVGDADNFRLFHTPSIGWRWPLKFRSIPSGKDLKDQTLHIRMAGVDAPEAAHFGKDAQPYSAEALQWLKSTVEGKRVWCQLILRDQYGRTVAIPMIRSWIPFRKKCVSLEMLKAGWACVYEQSNAVYGKWGKEHFLSVQTAAQKAKRGMWEKGVTGETPAEYKKRYAKAASTVNPTTS
ncbi:Probable endonuclease LCL3 [Serendipita indica DSM 11827]|nr:Probable endonuclease LCL3 [Serendipita indica DSM 11827]